MDGGIRKVEPGTKEGQQICDKVSLKIVKDLHGMTLSDATILRQAYDMTRAVKRAVKRAGPGKKV